ncbi:hypothetical protein GDO78_015096 [Eleutherodactylus coqui]|uniref:Uncharacterized protein n=1 Tax=Eleutherodactylus coqui TaxID=57060 RepID=A0A8J6BEC7_ELECQ|nr:hypothetical protein GDO78_015096 [Eleutherodactylus coqui]
MSLITSRVMGVEGSAFGGPPYIHTYKLRLAAVHVLLLLLFLSPALSFRLLSVPPAQRPPFMALLPSPSHVNPSHAGHFTSHSARFIACKINLFYCNMPNPWSTRRSYRGVTGG